MRQIMIGICDDEPYFLEKLHALVYAYGNEYKLNFVIDTYQDVQELMGLMESEQKKYELLFLDIDMPKMTGIDAAQKLRTAGYDGIICFVTSHEQYALQAFGVDAVNYILKPPQYQQVKKTVKKALIQIDYNYNLKEAEKRYLEVCTKREKTVVDLEQVLYVEKRRNQCVFHLDDGEIVCYEALKNIYPRLDQAKFCYTHQGFIANFDKVKEVRQDVVAFGKNREIPISRKYYKELKERKMKEVFLEKAFALE